ncbi:MAG TPA: endonuclease/exonuclease/phosphatase family protein [Candidatus Paceibacterota bacterium]
MSTPLKIAVANLQSGIGTTRGYFEYATSAWQYILPGGEKFVYQAAEVLKQEAIDIALLTEVNEISFRSKRASHIKTLEKHLSFDYSSFFPTIKTGTYIHEGSATLSKYPIVVRHAYLLPSFTIPRVLGKTVVDIEGVHLNIFVAHLSLAQRRRRKQIEAVAEIISTCTGPVMLGGDFNERNVDSLRPLRHVGLSTICFQPNYPSWNPKHPLDYLFLSDHFTETHDYLPAIHNFSDHAPLIIETTLR